MVEFNVDEGFSRLERLTKEATFNFGRHLLESAF